MGLSPATDVVTKVAPPLVVAWTLVMTTLDPRTLAASATVSRTITAMPGAGPALASRSAPLTGSWYVTDVVETYGAPEGRGDAVDAAATDAAAAGAADRATAM